MAKSKVEVTEDAVVEGEVVEIAADSAQGKAPESTVTTLTVLPSTSPDEVRHKLLVQSLNDAQVDFLLQRTPPGEVKKRQGKGGMSFNYVEHGYVTERLNLVFGFMWDFEVVDKQILEDEVVVEARLTVHTPGGHTIVKTQFGGADIKRHASGAKSGRPLSIADDYKAAASDALKKCASLLGIGLDLYGTDRLAGPAEEAEQMATKDQIGRINELLSLAGLTAQEVLGPLNINAFSELPYIGATKVIARLQERAKAPKQAAPVSNGNGNGNTNGNGNAGEQGKTLVNLEAHKLAQSRSEELISILTADDLGIDRTEAIEKILSLKGQEKGIGEYDDTEYAALKKRITLVAENTRVMLNGVSAASSLDLGEE